MRKHRKSLSKLIKRLGAASLLVSAVSCHRGGGGGGGNAAPETTLELRFNDDGTFAYTARGKDPDGEVKYLYINLNGISLGAFETDELEETVGISRVNRLEAIAEDNAGLKDPTPAIAEWQTATREEAYSLIRGILEQNKQTYADFESESQAKIIIMLDDKATLVDFLITRKDETYAIINYVDLEDDIQQELEKNDMLNLEYHIDALYLVCLPLSEIETRLNDFIKNDYRKE